MRRLQRLLPTYHNDPRALTDAGPGAIAAGMSSGHAAPGTFGPSIPADEFEPGAWRPYLFPAAAGAPHRMLHELADVLYGHRVDASTVDFLTPEDLVEGVRRVLLFRDPARAGVARADVRQCISIAAALARDAGRPFDAAEVLARLCGGGDARLGTTAADRVGSAVHSRSGGGSGEYVVNLLERHPGERTAAMPAVFVAGAMAQAVYCRLLCQALGFDTHEFSTPHGTFFAYTYGLDVVRPGALRHRYRPAPAVGTEPVDVPAPLVLLHGMFTSSSSMLPLALLLADKLDDRPVIVPDLLDFDFGFSRSHARLAAERNGSGDAASALRVSPLRWGDHVAAVTGLLEVLSDGFAAGQRGSSDEGKDAMGGLLPRTQVDLLGHSFGGWVASKIAEQRPELVRRVALLCPGGLGRYRIASSAAPLAGLEAVHAILARRMPHHVALAAAHVFDIIVRAPFTVHMLTTLDADLYFARGQPVRVPSLLLWGREDDLHRVWTAADDSVMLQDLPEGRGHWIQGANHAINMDSLLTCERLVSAFLLERRGAGADGSGATLSVAPGRAGVALESGGGVGGVGRAARRAAPATVRWAAAAMRVLALATDRATTPMVHERGGAAAAAGQEGAGRVEPGSAMLTAPTPPYADRAPSGGAGGNVVGAPGGVDTAGIRSRL
jgi:pimeloyl-ACP methyl ester carboxylesterase